MSNPRLRSLNCVQIHSRKSYLQSIRTNLNLDEDLTAHWDEQLESSRKVEQQNQIKMQRYGTRDCVDNLMRLIYAE